MKILIVVDDIKILGLAQRLSLEGAEVLGYSRNTSLDVFSKTLTPVHNLAKAVQDVKFVISSETSWDRLDKHTKMYNRPCIGANSIMCLSNLDYYRQYVLFSKFGLHLPETVVFDDMGDAIDAILDWNASQTIIRYGNTELRCDYKNWVSWGLTRVPFGQKVVFQRLNSGQDIVVTGWFNGVEWLDLFSVMPNLPSLYHYSMNALIKDYKNPLVQEVKKLAPAFAAVEYQGPVHVRFIVNEHKTYVHSMYTGFLFPTDLSILELVKDPLMKFLVGVAFPGSQPPQQTHDKFVGTVEAHCMSDDMVGAPINGVNEERLKHLVFQNAAVGPDGSDYMVCGEGAILTATARGQNVGEVCERVYGTCENIKFPEKHVDSQLRSSSEAIMTKLVEWNYA